MKLAFLLSAVSVALFAHCARAQSVLNAPGTGPCLPCAAPCKLDSFDIHLRNGSTLRNWRSAMRDTISEYAGEQQAIRFNTVRGGHCLDTVLPISSIASISAGGLGSMSAPVVLPIYPAREFHRVIANSVPASFIELTAFGGYGGSDSSNRAVGFPGLYEGVEVLVAPFGTLFGDKMSLALGAELLFDSNRMRIPAMGQIRYTLFGSERIVDSVRYTNPCFGCGGAPLADTDTSFHEDPAGGPVDSSVFLLHYRVIHRSPLRPFVYAEGAYIFNGSFTGAGPNPSINPSDYGQYFFGAGIGTPFGGMFTASLGYRYMRLNLRTPCPTCENKYILNTDISNSVMLKLGLRF